MDVVAVQVETWLRAFTAFAQNKRLAQGFLQKGLQRKKWIIVGGGILSYLMWVRYRRYKYIVMIRKKYPNPLDVLNNPEIAQEIHATTMKKEFPSTELALFKTFTIPTISKLLVATKQFEHDASRRAEDTELLLNEIVDTYGRIQKQLQKDPDTPEEDIQAQWKRPTLALERLNELHGKYSILNEDYIYTLSLFIFEPISWINRFEWRTLDEREINALFRVWYDVGIAMKMKDVPDTPEKMLAFKNMYAQKKIAYAPSNWKCGEPTVRHLLSNLPRCLQETAYTLSLYVLPSVLDTEDVVAFRLPHAESKLITYLFRATMFLRALFIRYWMLPRSHYVNRTPFYATTTSTGVDRYVPEFDYYQRRIYKDGYLISELGPDHFKPPFCHEAVIQPSFCPSLLAKK
ncbi:hypothetical protein BDF20DRAFT_817717 [Mycotypha africana]|uniref:uncharacterized protein n=1 Tax=Mycotypha africana TaxID=64632 RepID=UPI002301318D|nr:uncharacterized protein BDF20DRAFT_817717 [Mycotypha africana]KAI8982085.1 hypothetical protein BDF20DRAFT_817717 [Mycotypha africana]